MEGVLLIGQDGLGSMGTGWVGWMFQRLQNQPHRLRVKQSAEDSQLIFQLKD
jgi:hypothetical protein